MNSFSHTKLIEKIAQLDAVPDDPQAFSEWIEAGQHLTFLQGNADADELVIYGSGPYAFIHSIVVPNSLLRPPPHEELLSWSDNPYTSIASYVSGGAAQHMWIEREAEKAHRGSKTLNAGKSLIFGRTFEGWSGSGPNYFELNQEYSHLAGIHWRPEYSSYCRYDDNGDLDHVVSISVRAEDSDVSLVSFKWIDLQNYLTIGDFSLVRMFDFTLLRRGAFNSWGDGPETRININPDFFFRQKIVGDAAYTRGVQIIKSGRSVAEVIEDIQSGWSGRRNKQYVEFVAQDWRNKRIARISTDPKATTNYFEAEGNSLPFELSPAFFRPEVLSKYKTDREKYTMGERDLTCRSAWHLRGYDVNDAGQVHAYICDLRALPYSEQLHWLAYNEEPKTGISERAYINDFKGEFVTFTNPRAEILSILSQWHTRRVAWWSLKDSDLLNRANPPLTTSRDEWGEAMMDLAKLVVEGLDVKTIRTALDNAKISYPKEDQSIALLEKLSSHLLDDTGTSKSLVGLRTVQRIRSKVKGHAGSSEGKTLAEDAIAKHGSFARHFAYVASLIVAELQIIERVIEAPRS